MASDIDGHCAALTREADRDAFLSTLFAPAAHRPHLFALHAFNAEIARIRDVTREPLPGEIRLQWWREVLEGGRAGEAEAHPVASALLKTLRECKLPREPLIALLEARLFDLYDDPMPSIADLEGYCGETSSALFRLAAIVLADGGDPGAADIAGHGGVAHGITSVLRSLPVQIRRGQCYIPADMLARHGARREDLLAGRMTAELAAALGGMRALARSHLTSARGHARTLRSALVPAFLPLALAEGYLDRMERRGVSPLSGIADVPQWLRQLRLWRAARRGRF